MMREILFRGKRLDNGEWVEGFLFELSCDGQSVPCIGIEPLSANDYGEIYKSDYCEVYSDTVCQFTGLTDKDGKKIFEGDIVRRKDVCVWEDYIDEKGKKWSMSTNKKKDEHGTVRYDEKLTQFTTDNPCIWIGHYDDIEVIGNIHDKEET